MTTNKIQHSLSDTEERALLDRLYRYCVCPDGDEGPGRCLVARIADHLAALASERREATEYGRDRNRDIQMLTRECRRVEDERTDFQNLAERLGTRLNETGNRLRDAREALERVRKACKMAGGDGAPDYLQIEELAEVALAVTKP